jgi:nucleoside-diphosphate-sugar epimerase
MNLLIFGATGKTGQLLVRQALDEGNMVVVYARNPTKLDLKSGNLSIIQGELTDYEKIKGAMHNVGAVLSVLGPKGRAKGTPITSGMKNIIAAMKEQGVRRLVATSAISVKDPDDRPEVRARFFVGLVKLAMRSAYDDIVGAAAVIRESNLDWTILRLSLLNNNRKSGKVSAGYLGRGEVGTGYPART